MDAAVQALVSPYLLGGLIILAIAGQIVGAYRSGGAGIRRAWRVALYTITGLGLLTLALNDVQMLFGSGIADSPNPEFKSQVLMRALGLWAGYSLWVLTVSAWIIGLLSHFLHRPSAQPASVSASEASRTS